MNYKLITTVCFITFTVYANGSLSSSSDKGCKLNPKFHGKIFPTNFSFGVSTAAYQIEGAWNEDGKGPSIWDTFTHNHPEMIDDKSNGDVATDSYHRFDQDLMALKELKVQHYRFSISWPRVLPSGDISSINQKGIDYYNMIIDKLINNNIQPMVTMFHYDMPEELTKIGGFTNALMIKYFKYYADTLFRNFADRVKIWITFNEPFDYCIPGYGKANYPPMVHAPGVADYLCIDTTLKAHAAAYRLYRSAYFDKYKGKVGITISSRFYYSKNYEEDVVQRGMEYMLGWLAHPIFSSSGNYPALMITDIERNSMKEGRAFSRLPILNQNWLHKMKGAADFLGLNYYTSRYIEKTSHPTGEVPSWEYDSKLNTTIDIKWRRAKSKWLYCVPEGLEDLLNWIHTHYDNIEVIITENGWSDEGQLNDNERIDYLKSHLQAVLNAIHSGCNITAYTHWSLIDNFEWQRGYTEKFGLYYVNRKNINLERIAKDSAKYYKSVIESRTIPNNV